MKKEYMKPDSRVISLAKHLILMSSPNGQIYDHDNGFTASFSEDDVDDGE
jgi:hypothetical protein